MYNNPSTDDVIKLLFELKKDKHAERVLRLIEEIKRLQGQLEVYYQLNNPLLVEQTK